MYPGLPTSSVAKNPPVKQGDVGLIPGSGRFPGRGNSNPPQYSCLENPMDRGALQAPQSMGSQKSQTHLRKTTTVDPNV